MWMKTITTLSVLFSCAAFAGYSDWEYEEYSNKDYSAQQLTDLKEIAGTYVNSKGHDLVVTYDVLTEEGPIQGDLFEAPETVFAYYMYADLNDGNFEISSGLGAMSVKDGAYTFSSSEDDCQGPGCANHEAEIVFKKNKKGVYYASITNSVIVHEEDLSYIYNEEKNKYQLEQELNKGCEEMYGPTAYLDYHHEDDIYCAYTIKSFLKRK